MSEGTIQLLLLEGLDEPKEVIEITLSKEQTEAMKELIDFIKESAVEVSIRDDKNI